MILEPKCRILSAPPERITYSRSRPARISCRNENTPIRFDLPDPFAPITMLMGSRAKRSMRLMLLNPSTVIQASAAMGNRSGSRP